MSKERIKCPRGGVENVQGKMSKDNVPELTDDELALPLDPYECQSAKDKKNRRRQAIIGMITKDSHVSLKSMAEKLDVNIKTIWRDLDELKSYGVIERIGDDFTGEWKICKKKYFWRLLHPEGVILFKRTGLGNSFLNFIAKGMPEDNNNEDQGPVPQST